MGWDGIVGNGVLGVGLEMRCWMYGIFFSFLFLFHFRFISYPSVHSFNFIPPAMFHT
jgi:hypothetical protein